MRARAPNRPRLAPESGSRKFAFRQGSGSHRSGRAPWPFLLSATSLLAHFADGCASENAPPEAPPSHQDAVKTQPAGQTSEGSEAHASSPKEARLYVGGGFYSEPSAIYAFGFSTSTSTGTSTGTGTVRPLQAPIPTATAPTYLVPVGKTNLFAAIEATPGQIAAFRVDPHSGILSFVHQVPSGGDGSTHIAADKTGRWLFLSHYSSGSLTVVSIRPEGSLGPIVDSESAGDGSQAHGATVSHDNRHVYVPYKGIDRIGQYDFDAASGKLTPLPVPFVTAPKGSGPRHLVLHPTLPWSYAIDEKTSTISRYGVERSSGALRYVDSISSLPPSFAGTNTGAEIQVSPNGKYVYASNRGHDSIAVFEVNASSGALSPKEWVPSGGKTPRMFALSPSGHWAAVANQDSGNVALFRVDPEAGTWQPLPSTIAIDKPSWVGLVEP